jgi:hypothetical protein
MEPREIPFIALIDNTRLQENLRRSSNALGIACQELKVSGTRLRIRSALEDEKVASAETPHWTI